jgi:membrane protease YdiL (CAAX protease family)
MKNATQIYYLITAVFIVYFLISYVFKIIKTPNVERALLTSKGLLLINLKHVLGIILFGALSYLLVPKYRFLISDIEIPNFSILLSCFIIVIVSALLALNSVKKKLIQYTDKSQYSMNQGWVYFPIRIVFLLSYEFFFRGVLFFSLLEIYGLVTAIVINTLLYVLIHIFDSKQEIVGAIPFGVILCLFSYFTSGIWIAFIIHMTLSVVYECSMFKNLTLKTKRL